MSRIIIEATHIDPNVCFECGAPATERHHVVPASLGGTKTIPLCGECHAKVHDVSGRRRNKLRDTTKEILDKYQVRKSKKQKTAIHKTLPSFMAIFVMLSWHYCDFRRFLLLQKFN